MLFTIIMKFIYATFNFSDKFVSATGILFYVRLPSEILKSSLANQDVSSQLIHYPVISAENISYVSMFMI